jgi:VWFA-related protein
MWHFVARGLIRRKGLLVYAILAIPGYLATSISAFAQAADQVTTSPTENHAPFQLKVTSNLVVVRVVVRDAQNKPVENLKKEDFKLFDRGKQQSITQFALEIPAAQPTGLAAAVTSGQLTVTPASALPQRFLALYFDDLNMSDATVIQAREAADRYLAANLQPGDRVGLFTSGNSLSDFTGDPKQIHDALLKLHVSPVALRNDDCPDISDYQAQQIIEFDDERIDAWQIAIDQALNDQQCSHVPRNSPGEPQRYIAVLARRILEQSQLQSRANLQELEKVVNYVSRMPGQRTVVLVSPGFLSRSEQSELEEIIDHALRTQVVISSLDPRGLATLMREGNVEHSYMPVGSLTGAVHRLDEERESDARDVLQEVAQGTGGQFIHNNNDLQAGFGVLAGSPAYYLAFAPTDMKLDGKFHDLKVELAEKHAGFSIHARRGYFAPRSEAEAAASVEPGGPIDPDAQVKEQIREAVYSRTDVQQLPVTMDVKVFSTKTEDRDLVLSGRLDTKSLHLRKDGQRNLSNVTFVSAIFDQKDNLVQLQRGQAKLEAPDAQLQQVLSAGLKMDSTFELKPGIYRVREVVTDSEDHQITALSRNVNVSAECCATREVAGVQPIPAPQPSLPHEPAGHQPSLPSRGDVQPASVNAPTYIDYPLRKLKEVVPALSWMEPDNSQDQLSRILSKIGEATVNSLGTVPNLISREDVFSFVISRDGPDTSVLGIEETPALLDLEAQLRESRSVEFNYLLLFDHHAEGGTAIRELRTDFKNRQVSSAVDGVAPHGFGFAYQWLLLSPANQSELRFRYLGTQRIDDHQTFVLGFVQIPNLVKAPGKYKWAGKEVPFFFQGIAWIDRSTFDVVRLRTDLLSPVPSVNLQHMTTELRFRSVRIHGFGAVLWLPSEVLIRTVRSDSFFEEIHQYSGYKFFHAEAKLLP